MSNDLIQAVKANDINEVKRLIDSGANINFQNKYGDTALMFAAWLSRTEIVKILIGAGANINLQNDYGDTALIWAAWYERTEIVELLKKAGAK